MTPRRPRPALAAAALAAALSAAGPAAAQETGARSAAASTEPRDEVSMEVAFKRGRDIDVEELLSGWARKFGALLMVSETARRTNVRFVDHVDADLTWGAIKSLLRFHDVEVSESRSGPGGPWTIRAVHVRDVNRARMGQPPLLPAPQVPGNDQLVTAVVQIEHGAAQAIFSTIRGLQTDPSVRGVANTLYVPGPELLLITDVASRVRYYLQLVEAFDVPGPGRETRVLQVEHAPVEELAPLLAQVLASERAAGRASAGGVVQPGGADRGPQVFANARTNQLVAVATGDELARIEDLIVQMDLRVAQPIGDLHVYVCQNAKATYLAAKVQELFTGEAASGGGAAAEGEEAAARIAVLQEAAGVRESETRVVADERNNSLLIQAEPDAARQIVALLERLDVKKRRVHVEFEIWEVDGPNDELFLDVELAALPNAKEGSTRLAGASLAGLSQLVPGADGASIARTPSLGAEGLVAAVVHGSYDKIPLLLNFVQGSSSSSLVSKSFAETNANREVVFSISEDIPIAESQVTGTGVVSNNVRFEPATTSLTITPSVNSEGNLTLDIDLQIESFGAERGSGTPPRFRRSYNGEVTVPNGRYVVFGGLERDRVAESQRGVPFLSEIPILGHLFKSWQRTRSKSKLYIFVRPTILDDDGFVQELRLSERLRAEAHVESRRDAWLPPIVTEHDLRPAGWDLQDEAFATFGTGSGDPF